MFIKGFKNIIAAGVFAGAMFATAAVASPITYEGQLEDGVTGYVTESVSNYWSFQADAGTVIDLTGLRLDGALDLSFTLYTGTGDTDNLVYLIDGDDEIPANVPGPFGDPQLSNYVLPSTGDYTLKVWSFLSSTLNPDINPNYQLTGRAVDQVPVPAPAGMGLLGLGLVGLGLARRRRK